MKQKVVPKLRQEVKVKVNIVTSDDIKIYYTGKFQDFTAWYIIKRHRLLYMYKDVDTYQLWRHFLLFVIFLHAKGSS